MCMICATAAVTVIPAWKLAWTLLRRFFNPVAAVDREEVRQRYRYVKGMEKVDWSKIKPSNGDASRAKLIDARAAFTRNWANDVDPME